MPTIVTLLGFGLLIHQGYQANQGGDVSVELFSLAWTLMGLGYLLHNEKPQHEPNGVEISIRRHRVRNTIRPPNNILKWLGISFIGALSVVALLA
jgi:hypothetical protein